MGLRRRTFYSIDCNFCKNSLEDYVSNLPEKAKDRGDAEDLAVSSGWKKEGNDTWKCPVCLKPRTIVGNITEYTSILTLARIHEYKKIMIVKKNWGKHDWCIVNRLLLDSDRNFGYAYGYIHYANGSTQNGYIQDANSDEWKVIKVLDDEINVGPLRKKDDDGE